jgi:LruC domain-containing protein
MKKLVYTFPLLLLLTTTVANAGNSVQLTDVIKANGTGHIDLFKDVTAAQLEDFRQDNGGRLIFAVDINEDASGTESSISQGIAIKDVNLTVTYNDGSEAVYDMVGGSCSTETQSLLAESPDTDRQMRYTLLGEGGSNRITATNVIQETFDSTLKIEVPKSFVDPVSGAQATGALLQVILLETNTSLGDPEAFYDFTNGFEDLALLNSQDTVFIDDNAAGVDEAPVVILTNPPPAPDTLAVATWNYLPSLGSYYLVGYEDLYPNTGDYDFNDLTVAYQIRYGLNVDGDVVSINGTAYLLTRGAAYSHNWRLKIGLPETASGDFTCTTQLDPEDSYAIQDCGPANSPVIIGEADFAVFTDTVGIFPDPYGATFVNTLSYQSFVKGPKSVFSINLDAPIDVGQVGPAPFDPQLHVLPTDETIQLLQVNPAFKDSNGYPFGMLMPIDWGPPLERVGMVTAYPSFQNFVESEGLQSVN